MASQLSILNNPPRVVQGPHLLHRLIAWEKNEDTCALDFEGLGKRQKYTYLEIKSCVDSLLWRILEELSNLNPKDSQSTPQHIIPIVLPQSPSLYISQLSILESGGAFCPINIDAPKERVKFIVQDVSANLIITTSEFKDVVSWENGPTIILVDEFPQPPKDANKLISTKRVTTHQDLAYVMYTSGSTGQPKGVMLSHHAVTQSLLAHERYIPQFKRFLQFAAPSFDVSVFEIFFPLARGCTLVGCNRSQLLNDLPGMINELEVDAVDLTPTVVGSLLQKRENVPGLKLLMTIGEMLTKPIVEEFGGSSTGDGILYGMYGPTEAAIHCTIYPRMKASTKPGNIGIPLDTVSTFIAAPDQSGQGGISFLPKGEVGELVLGGPQLAHGYLNRPEQNAVAFLSVENETYYRTGDRARQLGDGTIEILGRINGGQVKLRGQRIELGEIEEAVYKQAGIKTATAIIIGSSLILFTLLEDDSVTPEHILDTCRSWLPKFMVPSEIVLLQKFPYLPSGKVDKTQLKEDYQTRLDEDQNEEVAQKSELEKVVRTALETIIGPFSSRKRLAAVGLDSLVAIRLGSQLRSAGINVPTVAFLKAETLRELVELCDSFEPTPEAKRPTFSTEAAKAAFGPEGNTEDVQAIMPCTPLQSAMLSETAINNRAYWNSVELQLSSVTSLDHVIHAVESLAKRNAILRTGFRESDDFHGYSQIIWKSLAADQIEVVEEFHGDFLERNATSVLHPFWVQIVESRTDVKLLIHLHHSIYDAWSLELLLDDLDLLLKAGIPPERASFADVVNAYSRDGLFTDSWSSKDYWKDHLAQLELRNLPSFHSRNAPSPGLAVMPLSTSIPTSDVEAAARRLSSSPQAIFQAAYALVLSSYLGSSDICFGTVFSGRTLPIAGIEDIVGPCIATLPVRVDISTSSAVGDLVQELNATNRKHMEYSTLPLREIKSAAGVNPSQALFDTLLVWQQTLHSYGHKREHVSLINSVDNLEFKFTMEIIPGRGNIELKANYEQALFPTKQIELLLQQVEQLAHAIIKDDSTSMASIFDCMDDELLSAQNTNPQISLKPGTLSSSVQAIAAEDPHRPAIDFATAINSEKFDIQSLTYGELNDRSNQLGHHLLSLDVLPDELVCICMEKSLDLYTSILATVKAGAGYLPVTPDIPKERLQLILDDARVKVIVTQTASRLLLNFWKDKVVYVDELDFSNLTTANIPTRSGPDNLAYCIFTSGSTGKPKGVTVTQGNLLSNLDVLENLYPSTREARLLQSCSHAFDVSVFEIFFTWRIGGCLGSATKDVLFKDIENAIRVMEVTHLSLTPTMAALVTPRNVPRVQFLVTAGEAVTQKVFNAWADRGLYQGYGPSETTNICTVNPNVSAHDSINNIGPPLRNTSALVLAPGPKFLLVPRGGEGEFCFGGSQVFRGYMNPAENVGKIIEHPKYGRLYRSGDFGRLMSDGSLAFTGRKDDQTKIRGQRVELGEINNVILRANVVQDCITMVANGQNDASERLVCFWTPRSVTSSDVECLPPDSATIEKIFKSLEAALPAYMIPSALIPISQLPSTTQGKIDKRHLLRLYSDLDVGYLDSVSQKSKATSDHTWSDLELDIANAVAQLMKVPLGDIGPDTSFFSLGIDSVSAISLSRILRQTTKRQIEISVILRYPSVARLASRLSSNTDDIRAAAALEPRSIDFGFDKEFVESTTGRFNEHGRDIQHILPCTPLQEGMLSAANSSSANLYLNHVIFKVHGNVQWLESCWREVVSRHEILRTCFVRTDMPRYAYVQVVLKAFDPDISSLEGAGGDKAALIEEAAQRTPSINELQPPWKLSFTNSAGSPKLLITMHHALYDGVALAVLYEEVEQLYEQKSLLKPVSFVPFLQSMISLDVESSDMFWGSNLQRLSPTRFELRTPRERQQPTIKRKRIRAPYSLKWVEDSARKHRTTLLSICQVAWASLLAEYLEEADICFGNVVSGRTVAVEGIDRLVAPCFNTIPIRLQSMNKLSYLEAFRTLQKFNADSLPFQPTPLRRIQARFSPDGGRLFDSIFILQQPSREFDASIWSIEDDIGAIEFPLVCEVVPQPSEDKLEMVLHWYSSVFSEGEASVILNSFSKNIEDALRNPRRQLLAPDSKNKILERATSRETGASARNEVKSVRELTPEELGIRELLSNYTDVPVNKIKPEVSIFRLGLDSISAVQVAAQLRRKGHYVMASDIMEHSTVANLAAFLGRPRQSPEKGINVYDFAAFDKQHRQPVCVKNSLLSDDIEAIRPCTSVQKGMIAQSIHSQSREYINSMTFEISAKASIPKLRSAWAAACMGHEMLRTGFAPTEDAEQPFVMVIYNKESFHLPWFNDSENVDNCPFSTRLLHRPWSVLLSVNNGKQLLKFTAHHALYDAISIQLILADVAAAYNGGSCPSRPGIAPLLGTILQNSQADMEDKRRFWQQEENKIIVNRFPDLTPLRVSNTTTTVREIYSITPTSELEQCCRKNGVTMQAAAQATWARLLAAYIGESSSTFGMTLSGRSIHEDAEEISFPSIITLPVRCNVTGTNAELLSRTLKSNVLLGKHQFTPLTSIQKWAGLPEGKVFDTLFAYQKLPAAKDTVKQPWKVVQEEASVDYAVSLEVQPGTTGQIMLRLTFRLDLIPVEHAELLLKQYDAMLLDTLQNPQHPCDSQLDFGSELLSITPAKEPVLPGRITLLHEFVEMGAIKWPKKTALEFATCFEPGKLQNRLWTYEELDNESNKIAQMLLERNIAPGELVAICFDKCPEASFAITGVLKAGCAYVALDPNAPLERIKFIVEDSGASLVLSGGKPGQNLKTTLGCSIILLDEPGILDPFSSDRPKLRRSVTTQDACYSLYTSGTTGTPKGCLITHENAVQAMYSFQRLFAGHWNQNSKWLQFASFHFDVSVLEQFWSWSVGICVASAPRDLIFEDLAVAIRQLNITHIDLTPSLARMLHPDDVPSLCKGVFITGGEQLRQDILDVWGDRACIYNGYGPTEATIGCTMYPRVPKNGKPSNIGPQFLNVGSFVLKPGTALPVLRGGVGELAVSGKLVGKGYLNRPELTNERFPTLAKFGQRVYLTGDLVRILHDGSFIFLGRTDDQVKLRGQRLELSEINEVIKKSVGKLQEVVTLVLKHSSQQKEQLVTFFVVAPNTNTTGTDVIPRMIDGCRARLPGYMVPTHFIPIQRLPLNANNKADTKQLAAFYNEWMLDDLQKLKVTTNVEHAWTNKEKEVLQILTEALRVENVALTRRSTIFELGLDSISIIGFVRRLQDSGFNNATITMVRSNTVLGSLVTALLNSGAKAHVYEQAYMSAKQSIAAFSQRHMVDICVELGVESTDIECIAPCTPVQEGMIYRFLESEHSLYFNTFEFNLADDVNSDKLLRAWNNVIARLQILRTTFVETSDGYAQVVLSQKRVSWENIAATYDTMEKPLAIKIPIKLCLLTRSSPIVMSLQIFHSLYDGNSMDMMLRRVVEEYNGCEDISYGPSFHASLAWGPLQQRSLAQGFWKDHLKNWVSHRIQRRGQAKRVIVARSHLPDLNQFEAVRKRLGVTPQAVVQAAWVSVLPKIMSANATIGIVTSGRSIDFESADQVIGPLFNTVPFHIIVSPGMTAASLISLCHNFNMQMQEFQHTPLKDILKWSRAKPGQELFETLFVFNHAETDDSNYAGGLWERKGGGHVADYPLAFEASLSPDNTGLDLVIVAQASYVTTEDATDLLQQFKRVFLDILENDCKSVVLENTDGSRNDVDTSSPTAQNHDSAVAQPVTESGLWIWTETGKHIRDEISILANIPEDSVRERSSIFELGLDSIDVIKLSSRLKKHGIVISVSKIIKCQTISRIVSEISQDDILPSKPASVDQLKKISKALARYMMQRGHLTQEVETVLPATPLQQSMINEMLNSNYKRYFNIEAYKLSNMVDSSRLMFAIQGVIRQSPILRTKFVEVEDPLIPVSYAQVVEKEYTLNSTYVLAGDRNFESLMKQFREDSVTLASDKKALFQVRFIRSRQSRYMIIAIAHALYDGRSIRSLHQDIHRAYNGQLSPRPDFKMFLENAFQSTTDDAKRFWRSTLSNLPPVSFPQRDPSQITKPSRVHLKEKRSRVPLKEIDTFCKLKRVTLQSIGQTCWALVLAHLMSQLDVVFGVVLSCRDTEEADEVMFPMMNTIAVRSVLHGSLNEMLRYMQEMSDSTRQYQHFPLGTAQAYAMASRDAVPFKDTTLFDSLFIHQGRRQHGESEPLYESVYSASEVEFPVCVEMEIVDGRYLSWTVACKAIARTAEETEGVIELLDDVLERMLSGPDAPTIVTHADGISVCGLPAFKKQDSQTLSTNPRASESTRAECSDTEIHLRRALHEVSGVEEEFISRDTTIFHLGLDSIMVLKLPALLKTSGISIKVSDILREQTIAAMAKFLHNSNAYLEEAINVDKTIEENLADLGHSGKLTELEHQVGNIKHIMPATAGQLFTIRHWQVSRGVLFYPSFTYILNGSLDKAKLESAWEALVRRLDILRTGFLEVGRKVIQVVFQNPSNQIDFSPEHSLATYDLSRPPVNLYVVESAASTKIILRIHHALYDGISLPNIIQELQALYHGRTLQPSNLSFRKFVAQSISSSRKPASTASPPERTLAQERWRSYLSPASPSHQPTLKPTSKTPKRTNLFIPSIHLPDLSALARAHNTTIDSLLLASISRILYSHHVRNLSASSPASSHIVFGIYLANRAPINEDFSALAAPTLNILPLCVKDPVNREAGEVAGEIQRDLRIIGKGEMSVVSLQEIFEWTGNRVGCVVNILKDQKVHVVEQDGENDRVMFEAMERMEETREVVEVEMDENVVLLDDGRCDAYMPCIDVEIRYREGKVDLGIFAPTDLLSLEKAEGMVDDFREYLAAI